MSTKMKMDRTFHASLLKLSGAVRAAVVAVALASGIFSAGEATATPNPPVFPWGNSNILLNFAVTNTYNVVAGVYGESSPGVKNDMYSGAGTLSGNYSFSNKAQVDQAFQQVLVYAANQATSNTSVPVNKSLPLIAVGYGDNFYYPPTSVSQCFIVNNVTFQLIYTNGNWILPDLSGIVLSLDSSLTFYDPGLEWARIEVYYATNTATPFLVVDSRDSSTFSATNNVDIPDQTITLATPFLASGYSGPYRLKVSLLTSGGGFQKIDSMANQVAETPFILTNFSRNASAASFTVTGGDIGRAYVIQQSPDLVNWAKVGGGPYTVNGSPQTVTEPLFAHQTFYRVATTNTVPQ